MCLNICAVFLNFFIEFIVGIKVMQYKCLNICVVSVNLDIDYVCDIILLNTYNIKILYFLNYLYIWV